MTVQPDRLTVAFDRRSHNPILREAALGPRRTPRPVARPTEGRVHLPLTLTAVRGLIIFPAVGNRRSSESRRRPTVKPTASHLAEAGEVVPFSGPADLAAGREIYSRTRNWRPVSSMHAATSSTKVNEPSRLGRHSYEPVKVIGTCRASRTDALGLPTRVSSSAKCRAGSRPRARWSGWVAAPARCSWPANTKRCGGSSRPCGPGLIDPASDAPPVVLNKHCPSCPFRDACLQQAEKEDNLSLLDRMTPKLMRKYHDKGIFTVRQLSHIYKPRRSRKKAKRQVRHSLELQALAIRTGKIHVEHLPELPRGPVELVVDLEGVPDRDAYYLAGLLVCKDGEAEYQSFWADDAAGEAAMWSALVERLEAFPDAPVYHYGNYEKKAFATLAKRHGRGSGLADRLVNVASSVYGKVYFPVRSNGLKPLGRFLGATWTDPQASGLQSLVWRHRWEVDADERYKQSLLQYNREDCEAVRMLVDRLAQIRRDAASDPDHRVRPAAPSGHATEAREGGPRAIRADLARGCGGRPTKICPRPRPRRHGGGRRAEEERSTEGAPDLPPDRPIEGQPDCSCPAQTQRCPKGHGDSHPRRRRLAEKTLIDLVFTRNGCRKMVTRYDGTREVLPEVQSGTTNHRPSSGWAIQTFGHAFQAWSVYQRVVLRLPYRIIAQVTEHLFGVGLSASSGGQLPPLPGRATTPPPRRPTSRRSSRATSFTSMRPRSTSKAWTTTSGCSPTASTSSSA